MSTPEADIINKFNYFSIPLPFSCSSILQHDPQGIKILKLLNESVYSKGMFILFSWLLPQFLTYNFYATQLLG